MPPLTPGQLRDAFPAGASLAVEVADRAADLAAVIRSWSELLLRPGNWFSGVEHLLLAVETAACLACDQCPCYTEASPMCGQRDRRAVGLLESRHPSSLDKHAVGAADEDAFAALFGRILSFVDGPDGDAVRQSLREFSTATRSVVHLLSNAQQLVRSGGFEVTALASTLVWAACPLVQAVASETASIPGYCSLVTTRDAEESESIHPDVASCAQEVCAVVSTTMLVVQFFRARGLPVPEVLEMLFMQAFESLRGSRGGSGSTSALPSWWAYEALGKRILRTTSSNVVSTLWHELRLGDAPPAVPAHAWLQRISYDCASAVFPLVSVGDIKPVAELPNPIKSWLCEPQQAESAEDVASGRCRITPYFPTGDAHAFRTLSLSPYGLALVRTLMDEFYLPASMVSSMCAQPSGRLLPRKYIESAAVALAAMRQCEASRLWHSAMQRLSASVAGARDNDAEFLDAIQSFVSVFGPLGCTRATREAVYEAQRSAKQSVLGVGGTLEITAVVCSCETMTRILQFGQQESVMTRRIVAAVPVMAVMMKIWNCTVVSVLVGIAMIPFHIVSSLFNVFLALHG